MQNKKSEAKPQYQSFVSPLATAFKKGSLPTPQKPENTAPAKAATPKRITGKITNFFGRLAATSTAHAAASADHWLFRLRLRNPHMLCYANASILALMYAFESSEHAHAQLDFLRLLLRKAAVDKSTTFNLAASLRFRQLTPTWDFSAQQKDAAEYLRDVLQATSILQVTWDTRCLAPEGVRLRDDHSLPIRMHVTSDSSLQQVINRWHRDSDVQALITESALVCIQLGRYPDAGKTFAKVDIIADVQLPVFAEGLQVSWHRYKVMSAVVDIGEHMTSGHYRAILRAGASWQYSDDAVQTTTTALTLEHITNSYVLWLQLC